jgi:hypothetical protein
MIKFMRQRLHVELLNAGLDKQKKAFLDGYFGVESSMELTESQLQFAIEKVKEISKKRYQTSPAIRAGRSEVLQWLQRLEIYDNNANWDRVNAFLMDPRICGAFLYELDADQLKQLRNKLMAIYRKQQEKQSINNFDLIHDN